MESDIPRRFAVAALFARIESGSTRQLTYFGATIQRFTIQRITL
jgi:hypothetical protein